MQEAPRNKDGTPGMTMPYENQLLGAFLYALGYQGGRSGTGPATANLFQQTPLDRTFGDLIVGASHCFALEFKRNDTSLKSERKKWREDDLQRVVESKLLSRIASRAHFMVYATPGPGTQSIELRFAQYYKCICGETAIPTYPVKSLMDSICVGPAGTGPVLGVSPEDLQWYLQELEGVRRKTSGGRAADNASWLAVAQKPSGFQFLTAQSLTQLLELRRENVPTLPMRPERTRDRGLDFGM